MNEKEETEDGTAYHLKIPESTNECEEN